MHSLKSKFELYLKDVDQVQDAHGFIESHECDSLLFTGLAGCIKGFDPYLGSAFDPSKGQWYRRPLECSCFPVGSGSTISRDMILGLLWYAYYNKRRDITDQLIEHALSHWGIMGQANGFKEVMGRCFIGFGLLSTAAWISYKLGGKNRWWLRWLPADFGGNPKGFAAHLQVLSILLRTKVSGKISRFNKYLLNKQFVRQPNNALFAIAAGKTIRAIRLLESELWWPPNRLPNSDDRKEQWLFQRDYGLDWRPGEKKNWRKHSGMDYCFVYALIYNKFK